MNARVLITKKCFRGCEGCCNDNIDIQLNMESAKLTDLLNYDSITLTGGEPMQHRGLTTKVIRDLRALGYMKPIYLYTSYVTRELYYLVKRKYVWGVTFTMHEKLFEGEIRRMKYFSKKLLDYNKNGVVDMRFKIEKRIESEHNSLIKNYVKKFWNRFENIEWFDNGECPIVEDKLLVLEGC